MIRDGIKYTRITNTATITPTYLADTPPNASPRAKFQAVIIPTLPLRVTSTHVVDEPEATYVSTYGIRHADRSRNAELHGGHERT